MPLRITTLSENTAGFPGMLAEWGLSILVETGDLKILLDASASISVPHNAPIFGLDLSAIDNIVLSHGHYDHTGGLKEVLKQVGKPIEVIAHPDCWARKYARGQGFERYVGVPFPKEDLEDLGASFEERVLRTGISLQKLGVQRVGVSHCTGLPSAMLLAQQLGEAFFFNNTGTSITVP